MSKQYRYRRTDGAGSTSIVVDEHSVLGYALAACARAQAQTKLLDPPQRELVREAQRPLIDRIEQLAQLVIDERVVRDEQLRRIDELEGRCEKQRVALMAQYEPDA